MVTRKDPLAFWRRLIFYGRPPSSVRVRRLMELQHVEIATDGACKGNPGHGGWGVVLRYGRASRRSFPAARRTPPTTAWS